MTDINDDYQAWKAEVLQSQTKRQRVCKELKKHLAEGLSINCFTGCGGRLLQRLIKEFPEDFDLEDIDYAKDKGMNWWEKLGKSQASGENCGNSRTWFYNMSNRYGWSDKVDLKADIKGNVNVSVVNYGTPKVSTD